MINQSRSADLRRGIARIRIESYRFEISKRSEQFCLSIVPVPAPLNDTDPIVESTTQRTCQYKAAAQRKVILRAARHQVPDVV